jgi:hypothetical protein
MTRLAGLHRSFPTMTSPFRWIGRSRRRMQITGLILLAMVVGPPLWWKLQLTGLPDIGDPFDVKEFQAFSIPDDRNADVLYHRAANLLKPWQPGTRAPGNMLVPWSVAMPELRLWVEVNRDALAVYRQASERPDALGVIPKFHGYHDELWDMGGPLKVFELLALLEGSRLEDQGDMEGAWGWYRAILRTIHLVGLHGTVFRRSSAQQWHNELFIRLKDWSFDSRTTPAMLRRALDEVIACESLAPSDARPRGRTDAHATVVMVGPDPGLRYRTDPRVDRVDLQPVANMAPRARTEPTGDAAGDRPLAGVLRDASRESARARTRSVVDVRVLPLRTRGAGQCAPALAPVAGRLARFHHRRQLPVRELGLDRGPHDGTGEPSGAPDPPGRGALPTRPRHRTALAGGAGRSLPQEPALPGGR